MFLYSGGIKISLHDDATCIFTTIVADSFIMTVLNVVILFCFMVGYGPLYAYSAVCAVCVYFSFSSYPC